MAIGSIDEIHSDTCMLTVSLEIIIIATFLAAVARTVRIVVYFLHRSHIEQHRKADHGRRSDSKDGLCGPTVILTA